MKKFRLTDAAIVFVKHVENRRFIAMEYRVSEQAVKNWASDNRVNGILTSKAITLYIKENSKLKKEDSILQSVN